MSSTKAFSSTDGFFQKLPPLPPIYTSPKHLSNSEGGSVFKDAQSASDDKVLPRILALYIPPGADEVSRTVHRMARLALDPEVLTYAVDAETNHPVLRPFSTFGEENRVDPLWTTSGWKALKDISFREGVAATAHRLQNTTWNRRVHQSAMLHAWSSTSTMTGCPFGMTDAAAKVLSRHLNDADGDQPGFNRVITEAHRRLTSTNPDEGWTSGQWMTERSGGSDVSGTETVARRLSEEELARADYHEDAIGMPLGPWQIDGFKWFSSATDSDMTLMLARTGKGISAFFAPVRRRTGAILIGGQAQTELNGIRMQRLKNKIGTKSLPTAELELKGMRAWLVGEEGQGIKEIAVILNSTRVATASGSASGWGRGLQLCRAFSKIRKVRGGLLQDNPQHVRWMANETVKYWAAAHFAFFGQALNGTSEQDWDAMVKNTRAKDLIPRDRTARSILLRLLTPVMKAQISVAATSGVRAAMECFGGVGYCENNEDGGVFNIAKVFRDTLVNPIWEGTVSVMAEDTVRVLTDRRLADGKVIDAVFAPWARKTLCGCRARFTDECEMVEARLDALSALVNSADKEELLWRGRELLEHMEVIVCATLLMFDACTDLDEVALEVASRWTRSTALPAQKVSMASKRPVNWRDQSVMDRKVFFGSTASLSARAVAKM